MVAIPLIWAPDPQRVFLAYVNKEGRSAGLHGSPLAEVAFIDGNSLTLVTGGQEHRYAVVDFDEPQPAPEVYLQDLEAARRAVANLGTPSACEYGGDHVQTVLQSGVTVEQLTNAVVLKWRGAASSVKTQPAGILRSSQSHAAAIRRQLEMLARDPRVGLDNRLMAAGTLLGVTAPEARQELRDLDLGDQAVNGFVSQYYDATSRCEHRYFATKKLVMEEGHGGVSP